MHDEPTERATGLWAFRRFTWWSLTVTIAVFTVLFVREWALDPRLAGWAGSLGGVALVVLLATAVVLVNRRLSREPEPARAAGLPVVWLGAGGVAAAALAAIALSLRDYEMWALGPAVMVSITATFLPTVRRRVFVVAGAGPPPRSG
ncbi:hypothetical protein ACFQYP_24060 [Nonomuraea antimicrobica]